MLSKLIYGYAIFQIVYLVRGTIPMHGQAALLNWIIITALTVFVYRRSPRVQAFVRRLRTRYTARRARVATAATAEPAVSLVK